jgi:hypothetical protein
MSRETDIVDRIKVNIQGVAGAGFTYDLSGDDRVVVGESFQPHRVPGVYIFPGSIRSSQTGRTALTRFSRTFNVQIEAWVAPSSSSPGAASMAALDIGSDIMKALEGDRSLNSNVHDISIDMISFDGDELQRPGLGAVVLQMVITYQETAGS